MSICKQSLVKFLNLDIGIGLEPLSSVTSARTKHHKRSQDGINFWRLPYDAVFLGAVVCFPGLGLLMETVESFFYGYMIKHIDLLRQNRLSHTTFVLHDDANAKNGGPECNSEEKIKITLVLFLMHSADPDGGSRTGIKIARFPQFDHPLPCSFIVLKVSCLREFVCHLKDLVVVEVVLKTANKLRKAT